MQYHAIAIKLALIMILASAELNSQGRDVAVHFPNDSTRSGNLLSVGDSSIFVQFPEYQWDPRSQEIPNAHIRAISFTHTVPGDASTFVQILGATGGVIVGGVAGAAIGDALVPEPEGFIRIRWGVVGTTLVGAIAGSYAGATIVDPSKSTEIRLDPNVPEQRDSLRVFLRTQ